MSIPSAPPPLPVRTTNVPAPDAQPNELLALGVNMVLCITIVLIWIILLTFTFGLSPSVMRTGLVIGALIDACLIPRMMLSVDTDNVCLKADLTKRISAGTSFNPNRPHNILAFGPGWHITLPWLRQVHIVECDDIKEVEHKARVFSTDNGTRTVIVDLFGLVAAMPAYAVNHWRNNVAVGEDEITLDAMKQLLEAFAETWFINKPQSEVRQKAALAKFAQDAKVYFAGPEMQAIMANLGSHLYGVRLGAVELSETVLTAQNAVQGFKTTFDALRAVADPSVPDADLLLTAIMLGGKEKIEVLSASPGFNGLLATMTGRPLPKPPAPPQAPASGTAKPPTPPTSTV